MKMTILAACEACAKMRGTNCCNVEITKLIVNGIVMIATICVGGYIIAKLIGVVSNASEENRKRKWGEEDKERKRNAELLDMKLGKMNEDDCISEINRVLDE